MNAILLPIVIGVVRNKDGHFLLGRRHQPDLPSMHGKWNLLGGRIEYGETPEEAVIREIKEEAGLDVEINKMIPKISIRYREKSDGTKMQVIAMSYDCISEVGTVPQTVGDPGVSELKFFPPSEVLNTDMMDEDKELIQLIEV
jgi:mutator protein MutT